MPPKEPGTLGVVIAQQQKNFRAKFGRDPGPDEPLFFDPDADEPRPLTDEQMAAGFGDMIAAVEAAGLDPAFIRAWQEVGYIIGTENRHLFSDAEVQAFEAAVARNREPGRETEPASSTGEEQADDDGPGLAGLVTGLADSFEGVVAATLRAPGPEPVMNLNARLQNSISDDEAGELVSAAVLAVLTGWLTGAREQGVDAGPAMDWVILHLGVRDAAKVSPAAGLIGYDKAPRIGMDALMDQLGPSFVPVLLWLACGLAASAGGGDAHWLRNFDLTDLDDLDPDPDPDPDPAAASDPDAG